MAYGTLKSKDGYSYTLTSTDIDMMARMADHEGGSIPASIWTVAQRAVLFKVGEPGSNFRTLAILIQRFSQPLNPIWRRDGYCCNPDHPGPAPGGTKCAGKPPGYFANTDFCAETRLVKRDRFANQSWSDLDEEAREAAVAFGKGKLPNPVPGATNFASGNPGATFAARPDVRVLLRVGSQVYGSERSARSWPEGYVYVKPPVHPALAVGVGAAAAALLWAGVRAIP